MTCQMALVCKARRRGHIRKPVTHPDHGARLLQPPHEQIAMRACGEGGPEVPRKGEAVETGDRLQLTGSHRFRRMCFEIIARQSSTLPRNVAERPPRRLCMLCKSAGNTRNKVVDEQLVELAIQLTECS